MKMTDLKNDVKKMIQDHVKTTSITKEIDSPYAKYNSRGQLMCVVCGIPVKSKIIWQAHVNKRSHKENLTRLKEKQEKISQLQYQKSDKKDFKRPLSPQISPSKKPKNQKVDKPKGILKNFDNYSSSEDEDEADENDSSLPTTDKNVKIEIKSELPDEFFDKDNKNMPQQSMNTESQNGETQNDQKSKPSTSDVLPEGFFDDPVADAKARNVEYRDKNAEEWESFLKEVSAAEVESRQIIAEDKVESAIETQLEQANEQIKYLERIVELDKVKQNQLSEKKSNVTEDGSDDSSDEEFLPVVWRTKNFLL